MSGTPITHSPADSFTTMRAVSPGSFPDSGRFQNRYLWMTASDYGEDCVGILPHMLGEFSRALAGTWRRISKAEALPFLPPKVRTTREVVMPAKWRKAYKDMATQMSADLPDGNGPADVMSVLAQLIVITALTNGPSRVHYTPDDDDPTKTHLHVELLDGSWKVAELLEILAERPESQVLVFTPSRQLAELAATAVRETGRSVAMIVGAQSPRVRDEQVAAFQSGAASVCIATTQAGGVGLTLTAASTVVFLSRPFALVDALQAEDRAHRIGSEVHESIEIIDVVTVDSVDQQIATVLRQREQSLREFLAAAPATAALDLIRGKVAS